MIDPRVEPRRLIAIRPPRSPRDELAPRPLPPKGGKPYERRLDLIQKRAWEGGGEEAVRAAAIQLGVDEEALVSTVARELFDRTSVERPAGDKSALAEQQWEAVERKLVSLMTDRGLDLDLACAQLGLSLEKVRMRCVDDPMMVERLETAFRRGTAKLHSAVWDQALRGKERAAIALLQARDPRFQPTIKVEISEQDILRSKHFQDILTRLIDVFKILPGEGGDEYRQGWADAMAMARTKAAEELAGG